MKINEIFDLCKGMFGRDVRYIKKLEDGTFEVHEVKHKIIIKYIIRIENKRIKVLEETEEPKKKYEEPEEEKDLAQKSFA